MDVPTIQIKVLPCPGNEAGIVTINESDFDPARHERIEREGTSTSEDKGGSHEKQAERQRKKNAPAQTQEWRH
jgi:hypothetical protein